MENFSAVIEISIGELNVLLLMQIIKKQIQRFNYTTLQITRALGNQTELTTQSRREGMRQAVRKVFVSYNLLWIENPE